ncbi:MAG: hypothetical protein ABSB40_11450 [Nitrososphaeria archaeon]
MLAAPPSEVRLPLSVAAVVVMLDPPVELVTAGAVTGGGAGAEVVKLELDNAQVIPPEFCAMQR